MISSVPDTLHADPAAAARIVTRAEDDLPGMAPDFAGHGGGWGDRASTWES